MQNSEIAAHFSLLADLMEIQAANPFRVRAHRNASRSIESSPDDLAGMVSRKENLTDLPGVGKDLAEKIVTLVETVVLPQLEELRQEIPPGVVDMLRIPGIGPKKVAVFYSQLKLETLE